MIDWATGTLIGVAVLSVLVNGLLIWGGLQQADRRGVQDNEARERSAALQRETTEVLRRQLESSERQATMLSQQVAESVSMQRDGLRAQLHALERQADDVRRARFPTLRATWQFNGASSPVGSVEYLAGSEPARDVEVFVRWLNADCFYARVDVIGPLRPLVQYAAALCDRETLLHLPLPQDPFKVGDPRGAALAVLWKDPDGTQRWWGQRFRPADGRLVPEGFSIGDGWPRNGR